MKKEIFSILAKKDRARRGQLKTAHGIIQTPFFMPIATRGAVKLLDVYDFPLLKNQIILSNTYHLYLKPGLEVLKKSKGLHNFMRWERPILTDSGGYQIFSLNQLRKIKPEGVNFKSSYDGSAHFFTPEKVIDIQKIIGSDIMMVLDECPPFPCTYDYAKKSAELTTAWAARCKAQHQKQQRAPQLLFGIVQGAGFKDLRLASAAALKALDFDGYAVGGLAVGEPVEAMYKILDWVVPELPENKPRYLMGVGQPEQILAAVKKGIDMFDCVLPTRNARHGSIYTGLKLAKNLSSVKYKILHITNEKHKFSQKLLDPDCKCPTCQMGYTRAYLRHLFMVQEPLAQRLATLHNVHFYIDLMRQIRESL